MEIQIIDLLNKYANNEKLPKKIKCDGTIWEYVDSMHDWFSHKEKCYMFHEYFKETLLRCLWYEVEIMDKAEKPKEIEEIVINENGTIGFPNGEWTARNMDKAFAFKINELVKQANYLLKRCNKE